MRVIVLSRFPGHNIFSIGRQKTLSTYVNYSIVPFVFLPLPLDRPAGLLDLTVKQIGLCRIYWSKDEVDRLGLFGRPANPSGLTYRYKHKPVVPVPPAPLAAVRLLWLVVPVLSNNPATQPTMATLDQDVRFRYRHKIHP